MIISTFPSSRERYHFLGGGGEDVHTHIHTHTHTQNAYVHEYVTCVARVHSFEFVFRVTLEGCILIVMLYLSRVCMHVESCIRLCEKCIIMKNIGVPFSGPIKSRRPIKSE